MSLGLIKEMNNHLHMDVDISDNDHNLIVLSVDMDDFQSLKDVKDSGSGSSASCSDSSSSTNSIDIESRRKIALGNSNNMDYTNMSDYSDSNLSTLDHSSIYMSKENEDISDVIVSSSETDDVDSEYEISQDSSDSTIVVL